MSKGNESTAIAVKDTTVSFESVHHIHCGNGQAFSVLGEGQGVSHYFVQEVIDEISDMVVGGHGNSLHSTSSGKSSECSVGDISTSDFFLGVSSGVFGFSV